MVTVREPRIDKSTVPNTVVKDQASTALWFEYTYGVCAADRSAGVEILYKNVALFAVHNMLFLRHSQAEVTIPVGGIAKFAGTSVQSNFRNADRSGLGRAVTPEEAFLTIIRAWEFATQRPQVSYIPNPTAGSSVPYLTAGAHWLMSEPLQWPVTSKDTETIRNGDESAAKRVLKQAETFWLETASEPAHPSDNLTPAHRFNRASAVELSTSTLIGKMSGKLLELGEATDYPEYQPLASAATDSLPPQLLGAAQGDTDWS